MPPGGAANEKPYAYRRRFPAGVGKTTLPPPVKLSALSTDCLASHLEYIRLVRMSGPMAVERAGGAGFLDEMERRYAAELNGRQLQLDV